MKKEVLTFTKLIQAGEKIRLKERVKYDGYIEEIRIRFYAGQENTLKVTPYVQQKGNRIEDFFTYPAGTDNYLSGEDDYNVYPVTLNVETDDEIVVYVENISNEDILTPEGFPYTLRCDIIISYFTEVQG